MKPIAFIFWALLSPRLFAQSIKVENLTYGKKESMLVFGGDNFFRVISKEPVLNVEYDKSLAEINFKNDSLSISIFYVGKTKSNWEGKNDELTVTLITKSGKQDITFYHKKLPWAFPSIASQLELAVVDKEKLITNKKVSISVTSPDTEGYWSNYKVQQFQLKLNDKTFDVTGDQLNNETVAAIASAKTGDRLILQEVKTFDNVTRRTIKFGPTTYVLK